MFSVDKTSFPHDFTVQNLNNLNLNNMSKDFSVLIHELNINKNPSALLKSFNVEQKGMIVEKLLDCKFILSNSIEKRKQSTFPLEINVGIGMINSFFKKYALYFTKQHSLYTSHGSLFHVSLERTVYKFPGARQIKVNKDMSGLMDEFLSEFWDLFSSYKTIKQVRTYAYACLIMLFVSPFLTLKKLSSDVSFYRNTSSFFTSTEQRIVRELQNHLYSDILFKPADELNIVQQVFNKFDEFNKLLSKDLRNISNNFDMNDDSYTPIVNFGGKNQNPKI